MNASILTKLEQLSMRLEEVGAMLSDPAVASDQNKFRELSIEYSQLTPVNEQFSQYLATQADIEAAEAMLLEDDDEMRAMAKEEISEGKTKLEQLDLELKKALLPKDPNDSRNIIIEIRAGTGGDEASIFSGDLFRMYSRYVEKQKWQIEMMSSNVGDHGGFKEVIARISGDNVYAKLKFESGAHRVQRVPETESPGRVHTSACTVAIMPEVENIEEVNIKSNNQVDFLTLREDFREKAENILGEERKEIYNIFNDIQKRLESRNLNKLHIDYGYALESMRKNLDSYQQPLKKIDYKQLRPKAFPQIAVMVDPKGDVYTYHEATFLDREGSERYSIGIVDKEHSLEDLVKEFVENSNGITEPLPHDVDYLDAFDYVITVFLNQAEEDIKFGIPWSKGPIKVESN